MTDTVNRDKNHYYGFDFFIERNNSKLNENPITQNQQFAGKLSRKWEVSCSSSGKSSLSTGLFFTAITGNKFSKRG